jgi:hypothetical protein
MIRDVDCRRVMFGCAGQLGGQRCQRRHAAANQRQPSACCRKRAGDGSPDTAACTCDDRMLALEL